jgi:ABC-2 type transport system permease protein
MKNMKWLLRREFWENKGSFFWAPAIVALVMAVFVLGSVAYAFASHGGIVGSIVVDGHVVSKAGKLATLPIEARTEIASVIANTYVAAALPLFGLLPLVVFFYCLAALYDERRDRSILFWKSLPVSDQMTVLSKVFTALLVAPLIAIAIGTAVSLLMLFVGLAAVAPSGLNLFGLVLSQPAFYLAPFRLIGLLPVYVLWAIPTVGWLLLVSSWARSKVLVWAVGVPVLLVVLSKWADYLLAQFANASTELYPFVVDVAARGLAGLVPGIWATYGNVTALSTAASGKRMVDAGVLFEQSWMTLQQPGMWAGVVVGSAMIYAAMRLRRYRDEG